jgi:hypothetical protein
MGPAKAIVRALALAVLALSLLGAGEAVAETVRVELNAPVGHPGAQITEVNLTSDGMTVGQSAGFLFTSGGRASLSLQAAETPDGLELTFAIPFGGVLSSYVIPSGSLAFDIPYFLPNPSPGGVVGPITTDPEGDDAYVIVSVLPPVEDTQTPICLMSFSEPNLIVAVIQDGESGLASISVRSAANVRVDVPAFGRGTTEPVEVRATIRNLRLTANLALKATDLAGNSSYCKSVHAALSRTRNSSLLAR